MIYDPDKNTALPLTLGVAVYKIDGVQLFFQWKQLRIYHACNYSGVHCPFYESRTWHHRNCTTRSSAVAERPRDTSCLSVVSFNCTYVLRNLLLLAASDLPLRKLL